MSLNFDSQGNTPYDGVDANGNPVSNPAYDGSQLGSMELYNLKLQKIVSAYTDFDAVSKKYVDAKLDSLVNGASSTLDTLKEIETYLTDENIAGTVAKQLNDLSGAINAEQTRASSVESSLNTRVSAIETNGASSASVAAVQTAIDNVELSAGLGVNGAYVADTNTNYLQSAVSLKDADFKLDARVKVNANAVVAEQSRAQSEEAQIRTDFALADSALNNRLADLEADPTTQSDVNLVSSAVTVERERAEAKEGQIENNLTTQIAKQVNDNNAVNARVNANDEKHVSHENRLGGHDSQISSNVAELQLHNTTLDSHADNISLNSTNIQELGERPYKASTGGFDIQHSTVDEYINGNGQFLYFSQRWRLYGESNGSRLIFEYNSGSQESPNWRPAVPFISSI